MPELIVTKVDIPWMFSAEKVFECIQSNKVLQTELQRGMLFGEYRDDAFKFTTLDDVMTIHLDRAVFTITELKLNTNVQPSELEMTFYWNENNSAGQLLRRLYATDSRMLVFVIRGITDSNSGNRELTNIVTIDVMINNPCTYYNPEGRSSKIDETFPKDEFRYDPFPGGVFPYWMFH
ncbi:MAG: hypothetical protein NC114_09880 [Ruminococcus flavefaciens]|nr:hypothetical protein [Ruminococcus flavefaciens]